MTCSGIRTSSCRHTSTSLLSICGTGTSSDGAKSTVSTICSTVCRWSFSCGLTPTRRSGRAPSVYGVGRHLAPWSVERLDLHLGTKSGAGLHAHGHPLESQPRAEPALPPPPCGADITFSHEQAYTPRWAQKLIFYIRTVTRNRNEIDAQKKSDFEHPTKKKKMKENDRK